MIGEISIDGFTGLGGAVRVPALVEAVIANQHVQLAQFERTGRRQRRERSRRCGRDQAEVQIDGRPIPAGAAHLQFHAVAGVIQAVTDFHVADQVVVTHFLPLGAAERRDRTATQGVQIAERRALGQRFLTGAEQAAIERNFELLQREGHRGRQLAPSELPAQFKQFQEVGGLETNRTDGDIVIEIVKDDPEPVDADGAGGGDVDAAVTDVGERFRQRHELIHLLFGAVP